MWGVRLLQAAKALGVWFIFPVFLWFPDVSCRGLYVFRFHLLPSPLEHCVCPMRFFASVVFLCPMISVFYSVSLFAESWAEAGFHLSQGNLLKLSYCDPFDPWK